MATRREKAKGKRASVRGFMDDVDRSAGGGCVKLPDDVEMFKLDKTGKVEVDILEFKAGDNNKRADKGSNVYCRTYVRHELRAPSGRTLIACRKDCFGERCAACKWLSKYGNTADKEIVDGMKPKTRHLWLLNTTPGAKSPTWAVFDSSHQNQGKGFAEVMRDALDSLGDDFEDAFSYGKKGKRFILTIRKQTGGGFNFNAVTRIDMRDRKNPYPPDWIDDAPCLDDLLIDPGYDEVLQMLEGFDDSDGEEEDESPRSKKQSDKKSRKEDDEDEDQEDSEDSDDDSEDDEEPAKKSRKTRKDDDEDEDSDSDSDSDDEDSDSDSDDSDEDENEEDDEPKRKSSKSTKSKRSRQDDEDEDEDEFDSDEDSDDDDSEDDEPAPKKKRGRPAKK